MLLHISFPPFEVFSKSVSAKRMKLNYGLFIFSCFGLLSSELGDFQMRISSIKNACNKKNVKNNGLIFFRFFTSNVFMNIWKLYSF